MDITLKHRQVVTSPAGSDDEVKELRGEAGDVKQEHDVKILKNDKEGNNETSEQGVKIKKEEEAIDGRNKPQRDELIEKALVDKHVKIAVDNSADNKMFQETAEVIFIKYLNCF